MRPTILAVAVTLLLITPASDAASQEPAALEPGTRIRVTSRGIIGRASEVGTVVAVADDTLRFMSEKKGHVLVVPRQLITRLDVSAGPGSVFPKTVGGSVLGAAGGAAAAFGIVFIMQQLAPECFVFCTGPTAEARKRQEAKDESNRRQAAVIGAAFGAIAGGLIGASHPSERWTKSALLSRAQLDVSVRPRGVRGIALELSGSF